ncbi:MAG: TipAS antibiotic-recognition domain-containing protein [Clostridia bacterium]|nr:TipAS antibiotic-recognition domain-containing protein [Clostridia bacterium]
MKHYEAEVRERWGNTDAYREHTEKTKNYTKGKWSDAGSGMTEIFAGFAALRKSGASADSEEARALVLRLQAYITENFYTCTDEILAGLGRMYTADGRFSQNIDRCGEGTAEFVSAAIEAYCRERNRV